MLIEKIENEIKNAMTSKNMDRLMALRMIKSELVKAVKTNGKDLDEQQEIKVLIKMGSQIQDSITEFAKANRQDLVEKEQLGLNVVKEFTPNEPTSEEVENYTRQVISTYVLTKDENYKLSMKDMGNIIKNVKGKYPTADGNAIRNTFQEFLKA